MCTNGIKERRQRLHDILLALLAQQGDLELMDGDNPSGLVAGAVATYQLKPRAGWNGIVGSYSAINR